MHVSARLKIRHEDACQWDEDDEDDEVINPATHSSEEPSSFSGRPLRTRSAFKLQALKAQ
jgi:hypothetical protein